MKELKQCLVCGGELKVFFDLGQQPLVNNLKNTKEEVDYLYPLVVNECPTCTHKQLSIAVDRELLFKDYLYQSSVSYSHRSFFNGFIFDILPKPSTSVLDIGCNDGYLLMKLKQLGNCDILGIEPCRDMSCHCSLQGISVINDYFPTDKMPIGKKFDVITAFNVFAHNDDPKTFLIEMAKLLTKNGRIYILTTPARLSNYYHEHISYFTPQSMMKLCEICGLKVVNFKIVSMHGESYLFEIKTNYINMDNVPTIKDNCVAYGASASEIVLFNYYKIHPEYVVDDNPLKQGKFIPGISSPIVSSEHLAQDKRDLTIIVAHNLFDEITAKIKKLRPNNKDTFTRLA